MTAVIEKTHRHQSEMIKHLCHNKMLTSNGLSFLAHDGRPWMTTILNYFLNRKGIAELIHIINPEIIVAGGKGFVAGRIFIAPIQHAKSKLLVAAILVV